MSKMPEREVFSIKAMRERRMLQMSPGAVRLRSKSDSNDPKWMVSFADLLSLILTFFVLMFSMSVTEENKWDSVTRSFSQRLKPEQDARIDVPSETMSITRIQLDKAMDLSYLYNVLESKRQSQPKSVQDVLNFELLEDRLVISLVGGQPFAPGQYALSAEAQTAIDFINEALALLANRISVYGNASAGAIKTPDFPSNWELSLARAIYVARQLEAAGYGYEVRVFGRGESLAEHLAPAEKAARDTLARRVDIVIEEDHAEED